MQIQQHIHFIDRPLECHRLDVRFPAPMDIGAVLGRDQPYYAEAKDLPPGTQSTLTKIPSVVSGAGVLHVVEAVGLGAVVSVELREDHTLTNLIVPESDEVILLANEGYLVLWVVAGHSGILVFQAQLVKDKENTHGKIRRNLGDVPLRDYLTRQILHQPEPDDLAVSRWPEVLKLPEASTYLRMGESTLRQKVAEGLIRRTPSKKFLKADLDAYLAGRKTR